MRRLSAEAESEGICRQPPRCSVVPEDFAKAFASQGLLASAVEIDRYAVQTHGADFPNVPMFSGDVSAFYWKPSQAFLSSAISSTVTLTSSSAGDPVRALARSDQGT